MKRNTYLFDGEARTWNDLAVKKSFWRGSVLRAFSLAFGR